jgi:type IV secretory pathway VirB4 component
MRLTRIVRDYREAGGVNSLLALWGFLDHNTFLTKAGHVGMVFRLAGVDYECLDDAERRAVVHRFEAALRVLDEHCRVYQYLCKRRIDPIEAAICEDPVVNDASSSG